MTAFAKKAAFCRTSPILMGRFGPRNRCLQPESDAYKLDLTQSPGLFFFPILAVHRIRQIGSTRLIRQVLGKALVRLVVCCFGVPFGQ
jgi:hypothetical protein